MKRKHSIGIRTEETISASHTLKGMGKCENLHGHNWKIEVEIDGKPEHLKDGVLIDFTEIKKAIRIYDHEHLNDFMEMPTAENLAIEIVDRILEGTESITPEGLVVTVKVWESEKSYAVAKGWYE